MLYPAVEKVCATSIPPGSLGALSGIPRSAVRTPSGRCPGFLGALRMKSSTKVTVEILKKRFKIAISISHNGSCYFSPSLLHFKI
jgi:hypothetical protein